MKVMLPPGFELKFTRQIGCYEKIVNLKITLRTGFERLLPLMLLISMNTNKIQRLG